MTKYVTGVTLRLSPNIIGTNESGFFHKLLLTDIKFASHLKTFANYADFLIMLLAY